MIQTQLTVGTESIQSFFDRICHFKNPEELFGDLGTTTDAQLKNLENCFRYLIKLYHPDKFAGQVIEQYYATEISRIVISLRDAAKFRIHNGLYGQITARAPRAYASVIRTSTREYYVTDLLTEGEFADVYSAYYVEAANLRPYYKEVVIKIIADPMHNSLVQNEINFYKKVAHFSLPEYIEDFIVAGQRKRAVILGAIQEGYDLAVLKEKYAQEYATPYFPQEHVAWILERLLSVLGLMHLHKILHGDIQPDNLIVQPATHNCFLVDFLHCWVEPADTDSLHVVNPLFCAPEVLDQSLKAHPVSELYALGKCMIYLLGGDIQRNELPAGIHAPMQRVIQKMVAPDPASRANDAWELAEELSRARLQIWGARHQFLPFEIGG